MLQLVLIGALVLVIIWLIVLSFFLSQMISHYNNLTSGVSNKNLKHILETIMEQLGGNKEALAKLQEQCDRMEKDGQLHIQKIGLMRFNPFKDTGGDQSFILSFVDANDTGVVISGLYSRSGTRWYAKRVIDGKGVDHVLSDEEKKALKDATSLGSLKEIKIKDEKANTA